MLKKSILRQRRIRRVRKKVKGTSLRPRLAVVCTNKHIYAQIIDDTKGYTLASASTLSKPLRTLAKTWNIEAAKAVGQLIAKEARANGIIEVCFDRRWRRFHGKVKALADAAREAGLKF